MYIWDGGGGGGVMQLLPHLPHLPHPGHVTEGSREWGGEGGGVAGLGRKRQRKEGGGGTEDVGGGGVRPPRKHIPQSTHHDGTRESEEPGTNKGCACFPWFLSFGD